jgi:hypothetical protein
MATTGTETRAAKRQRLLDELAALDASDTEKHAVERAAMLKRLVNVLLPADLKRNGEFVVTRCETTPDSSGEIIYADIHSGLQNMKYNTLAIIEFDFRDHVSNSTSTPFICRLELVNADRLVFHCKTREPANMPPGTHYGLDAPWSVDVKSDLDVFEASFHKAAHSANYTYHAAFGTTPAWCYILLSMLVYTDHVFDAVDDDDHERVQRAFREDCIGDILQPFWDLRDKKHEWAQGLYPFIVQLMPPAFALSIRGDAPELLFLDTE